MELREEVSEQDVNDAIELLDEATFKSAIDPVTGKIDMTCLRTGVSVRERQTMDLAGKILCEIVKESGAPISFRDAQTAVNEQLQSKQQGILRVKNFKEVIDDLVRNGDITQRGEMLQS